MDKLIITAALVGAEATRADNPHLPLTPVEIAQAAAEACAAGAAIIHLHVRDAQGQPTQDVGIFRETISLIRERCPAIIQVSTGGAVGMSEAERLGPVALHPEMASLTTGTVNFGDDVFLNPLPLVRRMASALQAAGVKPEVEVFDTGMVASALRLQREGLLSPPLHFGLVLGVPGGIPATPKSLFHLVESLPVGCTWSVAAIGRAQLPITTLSILLGGHARVGFEDNVYYAKGVLAQSNAQLVARTARLSRELGREVATPQEARLILGL